MKKSKAILFVVLVAINLLLLQILKIKTTIKDILIIQIFLFSLSFLAEITQLKFSKIKNITPAHFLIIYFLKILLCIVFLLPTILKYNQSDDIYIYNFFIIYFIYLFYDIILNSKKLNKINM